MTEQRLPRFGDLQGRNYYALPLKPPFSINHLSTALFPLRANLDSLQSFCNNYLNMIPKELGRFRAFSPYVLLMVMDYGSLALEITNLGWFAQHELAFAVPVEWYKVVRGKWVFQDWAMITPFIYVDDDLSLGMGRTVAGWPKTFVSMTPTLNGWMRDPYGPITEATVSAMVFPELYAGRKQEERVFLQIQRSSGASNMRLPFNVQSQMAPWTIASNIADSVAGLGRDAFSWLAGFGIMPRNEGTSPENYRTMLERVASMANPMQPRMRANILNLKQFRASEEPDRYCYQSLTNGSMDFTTFNGMGLLGEQNVMLGDISGGYSLKVHEWPSLPITRILGLEVANRWRGDGVDVSLIKPVMPFWYDCNMTYDTGYNLAWRTRDGLWKDQHGKPYPDATADVRFKEVDKLYNTTLGSSAKPVAGPFRFFGTTVRVLPLLARRARLTEYLDSYLNEAIAPAHERFRLWAPDDTDFTYVYLTATSFGETTSGTNNVGDWADRELAFLIPVRHEREVRKGEWELAGVGVVPAYTYVNNVTAALAGSEVLGIPTTSAEFIEAESSWMSQDGPAREAEQVLLRVNAEVLPVVGEGERSRHRQIVEISAGLSSGLDTELAWRVVGDRWSSILRDELERKKRTRRRHAPDIKHARAMALEILGNETPISLFTMKQFRDDHDPDQACYQSIVRVQRTFGEVLDLREIEDQLLVRINDFPTQAIVDVLGIVAEPVPGDGVGLEYLIQPIRPFWLRVTMDEQLGRPLMYRGATDAWTRAEDPVTPFFQQSEPPAVGVDVTRVQDEGDPRRMTKAAREWKVTQRDEIDLKNLTFDDVRNAIDRIDPQMVIETILSREWGNWDGDARWRVGRRRLVAEYRSHLSGVDRIHAGDAEAAFFEAEIQRLGKKPGEPPVDASIMLEQLKVFNARTMQMEEHWSVLVRWALERMYPSRFPPSREHAPPHTEVCAAILEFLDDVIAIAEMRLKGEPSSPDDRTDYATHDNTERIHEVVNKSIRPLRDRIAKLPEAPGYANGGKRPSRRKRAVGSDRETEYHQVMEQVWGQEDLMRTVVALARERTALQREALFNQLCKSAQKPDFCIQRSSAGPDSDRLFPMAESWDEFWYVGPAVEHHHRRTR